MRSATGRWVCGEDFFDRERELEVLKTRVREWNHVLLTGQRRMGKTSILRELGSRLESEGWIFLFADVEGANCSEDAIAEIARAAHPVGSIASRFARTMTRVLKDNVEEISAPDFSVKIRAGLDAGSWRRHGEQYHVQSFFARLRDFSTMHGGKHVTVKDVAQVYRTALLGPWGQTDLVHYETRLKEALDNDSYALAMHVLAETATQGVFTDGARRRLATLSSGITDNPSVRIADTLEVLIHDGYLESTEEGYRFPSRLLRDWWSARFRGHYVPLERRRTDDDFGEPAP